MDNPMKPNMKTYVFSTPIFVNPQQRLMMQVIDNTVDDYQSPLETTIEEHIR